MNIEEVGSFLFVVTAAIIQSHDARFCILGSSAHMAARPVGHLPAAVTSIALGPLYLTSSSHLKLFLKGPVRNGLGPRGSLCSSTVKTSAQAMSSSNMRLRSIAAKATSTLSALNVSVPSAVAAQLVEQVQVEHDDENVSTDVTQAIDVGTRPLRLFSLKTLSSAFLECTPPFNIEAGRNNGKERMAFSSPTDEIESRVKCLTDIVFP